MTRASGETRRELGALLRLALPLVGAHAASQLMGVVDTAMVGRLGAPSLAGVGIGNGLFFAMSLLASGCVLGMDPLVAQAIGAREEERARAFLGAGIRLAVVVAIPAVLAVAALGFCLEPFGVDPAAAREGRRFLLARALNVIPFSVFFAQRAYLQARGATWPVLLSMLVANVANVIGNLVLIWGDQALVRVGLPRVGLPPLGVVGSGLSSTIASVLSVVVLTAAIRALHGKTPRPPRARHLERAIFRIGMPLGLQMLAEVGVFALAGMLAGRMSAGAAAGHQVALNLASITFTVTIGIGAAASVRVGHHVGRGDSAGARRAGFVALGAAAAFMSCSALTFLAVPRLLARALTDDPAVLVAAAPLIMIAAVFQLSDGTQAVAAGALRGAGDTRASLLANVVGHYFIGLPIAIVLGFTFRMGAPGLWWGLSAGLTAVAIGLTVRFARISSRALGRV